MTTITTEIQISGIGLMDGKEATVKITPSSRKGIYFYPENSNIAIKACLDNVISTSHCTVLGYQDKQVRVVEHFMAACAFAGIDDLEVYLSSSEIPILDGSALIWIEALKKAGKTDIDENNYLNFEIKEPTFFSLYNTNLVLLPSENFTVSYCVNFQHPDLERKWYSWNILDNPDQIIEARTFGYLKDLENFQKTGLALGAKIDNIVGLTESGYTTELRSEDEPIKHKILDLIGDLRLLELNPLSLKAHIIAQEAGHKTHIEFARVIQHFMERKLCQQTKN
ncbi:MAG: UDP-3-O-acyl-N-acetylglucosamine deacetylase [bacterium]